MLIFAIKSLFSITDFAKQLGSVVKSIKNHSIDKIGILKIEDMKKIKQIQQSPEFDKPLGNKNAMNLSGLAN